MTQHTEVLQTTLYEEMLASKKPTFQSHTAKVTTTTIHAQNQAKLPNLLSQKRQPRLRRSTTRSNELAQGHEYFSLGVFS